MKSGNLYKQLVKSRLSLKGFYIDDVEKFQKNGIFVENDFFTYTRFEYEDYILYTGHKLKFTSQLDSNFNIIELPVFIHLRPFKLFVFKINFVLENYFQLVSSLNEDTNDEY